jgi:hypothetical protein
MVISLSNFCSEQNRVAGHVFHIVASDAHPAGLEGGGIEHQQRPARNCCGTGQQQITCIKTHGAQRDKDEDV